MNRLKSLLFFAIMLFCMYSLFSCNKGGITNPENQENMLFTSGTCDFRIVCPHDCTENELSAAEQLRQLIYEKCGVSCDIIKTSAEDGYEYDSERKEIVLSYVSTPEFHKAIASVGYNNYVVALIGNKIIVTGHEREGFTMAFESLINYINKNTVEGELVLPEDLLLTGDCENFAYFRFLETPGYPGGMVHDMSLLGDDYRQITIYETTEGMFSEFASRLENSGYTKYSENKIADNLYATYTKDKEMIYFYYCPVSKETRIIFAENIALPEISSPSYEKICEPVYASILLHNSEGEVDSESMGAIIRLEDGTFLLYDGGNNVSSQTNHIIDVLNKLAPDPSNIVIRAWILSHQHGDHVGAFLKYAENPSPNITVNSFIYNYCFTSSQTETLTDLSSFTSVPKAIKKFDNATVYKPLTGQVFHFPGMDMEILATMSDFIPQVIGKEAEDADVFNGDGNSMSIIVRLKELQSGNTCMLTADATNIVLDDMVDRYSLDAEYLDTDIVTTPHHAYNTDRYRARNATIKFYDAVKPDILVVSSTSLSKFKEGKNGKNKVNAYVLSEYDPEIYVMNELRFIDISTLKEIIY